MRIAEIRVHQIQLPLTKPYRVSFRTYTALEPFIVEMPSWAEACIGRLFLTRAGDMNGFLKPKTRLFEQPLVFDRGAMVLKAGFWPEIDRDVLKAHTMRSERFAPVAESVA